jgi:hypothetical protein
METPPLVLVGKDLIRFGVWTRSYAVYAKPWTPRNKMARRPLYVAPVCGPLNSVLYDRSRLP